MLVRLHGGDQRGGSVDRFWSADKDKVRYDRDDGGPRCGQLFECRESRRPERPELHGRGRIDTAVDPNVLHVSLSDSPDCIPECDPVDNHRRGRSQFDYDRRLQADLVDGGCLILSFGVRPRRHPPLSQR